MKVLLEENLHFRIVFITELLLRNLTDVLVGISSLQTEFLELSRRRISGPVRLIDLQGGANKFAFANLCTCFLVKIYLQSYPPSVPRPFTFRLSVRRAKLESERDFAVMKKAVLNNSQQNAWPKNGSWIECRELLHFAFGTPTRKMVKGFTPWGTAWFVCSPGSL